MASDPEDGPPSSRKNQGSLFVLVLPLPSLGEVQSQAFVGGERVEGSVFCMLEREPHFLCVLAQEGGLQ